MATAFRFIPFLLLLFFGTSQSFSQTNCTRIEFESIPIKGQKKLGKKNELAKVGYMKYDASGNIIEDGSFINSIYSLGSKINIGDTDIITFKTFTLENKLIEENSWKYNKNRKSYLIYKTLFKYDNNGNLIQELKIDSFSRFRIQKKYHYSSNTIVTIDSILNLNTNASKEYFEGLRDTTRLDSVGRISEILHYSSKNDFIYRTLYVYDKFSFGKTELRYDGIVSNLYSLTDYQFNFRKKLIQALTILVGKNHEQKEIFSYNESGWLDTVLRFSFDEQVGYTKYEYISAQ